MRDGIRLGQLITAELLRSKGASCPGIGRFRRLWPHGARLNKGNLLRAAESSLDLSWFAANFMKAASRKEYKKKEDSLWNEYRKKATLQNEYDKNLALLIYDILKAKGE